MFPDTACAQRTVEGSTCLHFQDIESHKGKSEAPSSTLVAPFLVCWCLCVGGWVDESLQASYVCKYNAGDLRIAHGVP